MVMPIAASSVSDHEEVGQAPHEDRPVVLQVEIGHASSFLAVLDAGVSPPRS